MNLLGLSSEAERNPLKKEPASLATLDVQNTATELGRDRDMGRDASMAARAPCLPRRRKREKKNSAAGE